jgi:hypothetical protein
MGWSCDNFPQVGYLKLQRQVLFRGWTCDGTPGDMHYPWDGAVVILLKDSAIDAVERDKTS